MVKKINWYSKPILNWRKTELDRKTVISSVARFNDWLLRIDGGRIQLDSWLLNDAIHPLSDELVDTTIWAELECIQVKNTVLVDENCKVYGSSNLYSLVHPFYYRRS